jgi:flagellar protein FliO/FliZ
MWQAVLGVELPLWLKFIIVFPLVLVLIWAFVYGLKRFGGGALGRSITPRGRQPRLAVIETTSIDARRQLWLIRRDNVEHLIMTGGPTDLVVEPNIVRAAAAPAREAAPTRAAPTHADGGNWPLQPDAPPPRAEPPVRAEPPLRSEAPIRAEPPLRAEAPMRPQRAATPPPPPAPPPPAAIDADAEAHAPDWSAREEPAFDSELPPRAEPRSEPPLRAEPMLRAVPDPEPAERPQRAARMQNSERNSERLAGLAADLSRNFLDSDLATPRRPAAERRPPPPPTQPVAPVPPLSEAEEQNLTEMAQRLESALARPRAAEPAPLPPPPPSPAPTLRAVELPREPAPRPEIVPPPAPAQKPAAKAAPGPINRPITAKPALSTLEQEMASLLGRSSSGKT